MEGNYPPGFFCPDREQQESRHLQHQQPQPQQQHDGHFPLELTIPYTTTSQQRTEFVDQALGAFPISHPATPLLRSIYHETAPMLPPGGSIPMQQVRHPRGQEVNPAILPANQAPPMTTHEPLVVKNNTSHAQDPTPTAGQSKKTTKSKDIPNTNSNTPTMDSQLLMALNLKKNSVISSGQELPKGLVFKVNSFDKVEGVVAKETVQKGVEFGPYTGILLDEEEGWCKDATWEVCNPGGLCFYLDGRKNWLSHLRCARTDEEQNMEAYQYYGNIYFRTTKVIKPGSELRAFYGDEYKRHVGVQMPMNDLGYNQEMQKFQCSQCDSQFASAKVILRHIRLEHTAIKVEDRPMLIWKKKKRKMFELEAITQTYPIPKKTSDVAAVAPKQQAPKSQVSKPQAPKEVTDASQSVKQQQQQPEKETNDSDKNEFRCTTCKKVFASAGILKAHQIFHFNPAHSCPVCGRGQPSAKALERHMQSHGPKMQKCKRCGNKYVTRALLERHIREVHGFFCRICQENFPRKSQCLEHERTHMTADATGEKPLTEAQKELLTIQPSEPSADEPLDMLGKRSNHYLRERSFKCRFCPKRYMLRKKVCEHEKEAHTGEGAFKCSHCPRVFTSEARMMDHLKCHEQNRMYRCTLCPKTFASESALNNHQGEHTGLKPFKCEICNRGFRTRKFVYAHKRRVHQDRPKRFFCSVCNKGFADKGNLIKHERRHKGIRPYVCLECGKAFTGSCALTAHKKALHTAEKAFSCEICGKKFSLNQHYTYHMFKHRAQGDSNLCNTSNSST